MLHREFEVPPPQGADATVSFQCRQCRSTLVAVSSIPANHDSQVTT
jgi:hypothetical protein